MLSDIEIKSLELKANDPSSTAELTMGRVFSLKTLCKI